MLRIFQSPHILFLITLLCTILLVGGMLFAFLAGRLNWIIVAINAVLLSILMGLTNYAVQRHFDEQHPQKK